MSEIDDAIAFVRDHRRAVVATARPGGGIELTPAILAVDDDGTVLMSSREGVAKVENIRREGRAKFLVIDEERFGRSIQLEGEATVISMPDALPALEGYYRRAAGEHPDWGEYRAAMEAEQRVIVRVTVDRAG